MADDRSAVASFPWRGVLIAVAVGVALRLAFGLIYWVDKPLTRDEREYLSLARGLADGRGFVYDDEARAGGIEPFSRAPGYPAFVAGVGGGREITPSVPLRLKIAQSVVAAVGILMAGVLARRIGGQRAAIAAAAIAAVYPPLVWISGYAFSEALFWPLGLVLAWTTDRALDGRGSPTWGWTSGLVAGLSILIRPGVLLFVPLAMLFAAVKRQWHVALALSLGTALVVGPWAWRTSVEHGRVILVAAEGGVTFWTGNHPLATGDGDMAANAAIKRDNERFRSAHPRLPEEALEPIYYREALAWIAAHPITWIGLEFRKLFYLIVPIGPSYSLHSPLYYGASVVSYLSVLALAIMAWTTRRAWPGRSLGLIALATSAVLSVLIFFAQERFRIPVIDPTLVIVAGAGLAHRTSRSRS